MRHRRKEFERKRYLKIRGRKSPSSSLNYGYQGKSLQADEKHQEVQLSLEESGTLEFQKMPRPLSPPCGYQRPYSIGRGYVYTYSWFMLLYSRNQHNIVKQLSPNFKKLVPTKEKRAKGTILEFAKEKKQTLLSFHSFSIPSAGKVLAWHSSPLGEKHLSLLQLRMGKWLETSNSKGDEKARDLIWEMRMVPLKGCFFFVQGVFAQVVCVCVCVCVFEI